MSEDTIFKALADPTRRQILTFLLERDGLTLTAIESRFEMSRFGVMKHLRLLEDAGLVRTQRLGREKFHFVDPLPIQVIHDRWVSAFIRSGAGKPKAGTERF